MEMSNVITDKASAEVQGPISNLKCLCFSFEVLLDGLLQQMKHVHSGLLLFRRAGAGNQCFCSILLPLKLPITIRNVPDLINFTTVLSPLLMLPGKDITKMTLF